MSSVRGLLSCQDHAVGAHFGGGRKLDAALPDQHNRHCSSHNEFGRR